MAVVFSDDFNRADSGTLGGNWVEGIGTWAIASNELYASSTGAVAYDTTDIGSADYSVTVVGRQPAANGGLNILARLTATNNFYLGQLDAAGGLQIYKQVSGSWTLLQSSSMSVNFSTTSYTLKLKVEGTSIDFYVDDMDTAKVSTTDSSISSQGYAGLRTGGGTAAYYYDDFVVDDLTAGVVGGTVSNPVFPSLKSLSTIKSF